MEQDVMAPALEIQRPPQWYRPKSIARSIAIRPRVYLAALAAFGAAAFLPPALSGNLRTAIAGDIGAIVYLTLGFRMMMTCGSELMRKRAARQDDSRLVILVLVLVAIALSFWTVVGVLSEAKQVGGQAKILHTSLAAATVLLSWLVTQVVFTFHYAHEFYRPDDGTEKLAGGLEFPHDSKPDYWDFFYFATSLGAASQTSDVNIRTKALRRLVTLHAVISFFFNTAVLALAINIGASMI
jgi:uncharacterized membrane protein